MPLRWESIYTEIYKEVCAILMQQFCEKTLKEAFCSDDFDMNLRFAIVNSLFK